MALRKFPDIHPVGIWGLSAETLRGWPQDGIGSVKKEEVERLQKLRDNQRQIELPVYGDRKDMPESQPFSVGEIKDLLGIIVRLRKQSDPVSEFLWNDLLKPERSLLKKYEPSNPGTNKALSVVVQLFHKVIGGSCIHDLDRFKDITLRPETTALIEQKPIGNELVKLNRLLLQDTYPEGLSRN